MVETHPNRSRVVSTPGVESDARNRFPRPPPSEEMSFPRPSVDIRRPPPELDALIEWFESVSYRLVLLEEYPLTEVQEMVRVVSDAVALHGRIEDPLLAAVPRPSAEEETLIRILVADHAWFRTSAEQLEWFLSIVVREDHGGHRQALGQYGRVFAESLRRHRADERELARRVSSVTLRDGAASVAGNRK